MYIKLLAGAELHSSSWLVLNQLGAMKEAAWSAFHSHAEAVHGRPSVEPHRPAGESSRATGSVAYAGPADTPKS
jgi:hypothetical protein